MMARGGRLPYRRNPLKNPSVDGPERPPELKNTLDPTPKECAEVKRLLGKATSFPPELVDIVMDFAEYWACSVTSIDYSVTASKNLAIHGGRDREDKFIVRPQVTHRTTLLLLLIRLILASNRAPGSHCVAFGRPRSLASSSARAQIGRRVPAKRARALCRRTAFNPGASLPEDRV